MALSAALASLIGFPAPAGSAPTNLPASHPQIAPIPHTSSLLPGGLPKNLFSKPPALVHQPFLLVAGAPSTTPPPKPVVLRHLYPKHFRTPLHCFPNSPKSALQGRLSQLCLLLRRLGLTMRFAIALLMCFQASSRVCPYSLPGSKEKIRKQTTRISIRLASMQGAC